MKLDIEGLADVAESYLASWKAAHTVAQRTEADRIFDEVFDRQTTRALLKRVEELEGELGDLIGAAAASVRELADPDMLRTAVQDARKALEGSK